MYPISKMNMPGFLKILLFTLVTLVSITSCNSGKTDIRLAKIDTLISKGQTNKAYSQLKLIQQKELSGKNEQAYRLLLMTKIKYELGEPMPADDINTCIKAFDADGEEDKLSAAYFYKGEQMCNIGHIDGGIEYIKKAEQTAARTDYHLLYLVSERLAEYNNGSLEYRLSQTYAGKALNYAVKAGNPNLQAKALMQMADNYEHLRQHDSAMICIDRCLPLIKQVSREHKANILDNIAMMYLQTDIDKAGKYINEALKYDNGPYTSLLAAVFYYNTKQNQVAESYMNRVSTTGNPRLEALKLKVLIQVRKEEQRFQEVCKMQERLTALSDSMVSASWMRRIKDVQTGFDNRVKEEQNRRNMTYAVSAIVLLALVTISVSLHYRLKTAETKHLLDIDRKLIEDYNHRISILESASADNKKTRSENEHEIKRLQNEITTVENRHSGRLADGRKRFMDIQNGQTTVMWTKDNYMNFVEYYKLVNPALVNKYETEYRGLTYRAMTYAILNGMGKSDEEIASIMGTTPGAVRTTRSRITARKV